MSQKSGSSERSGEHRPGCYFFAACGALVTYVIVKVLRPTAIPFDFFQFVKFDGTVGQVLVASWPIFVWVIGVSIISTIVWLSRSADDEKVDLKDGFMNSLLAGFFEEISFRWFTFYGEIASFKILDFLLLGFANIHIVRWLFESIMAPVANFFTLGILAPYLLGGFGWAVGAAVIWSNGKFRNGHIYMGIFGFVNSWFIGMFLFMLMFRFGLLASMMVHFLYDFTIYVIAFAGQLIRSHKV